MVEPIDRDALEVCVRRIAEEAVAERMAAAEEHGYDLKHDSLHGVFHVIDWAKEYILRAEDRRLSDAGRPGRLARRRNLVKAVGLLLSAIDLIDHYDRTTE